MTLSSQREQRLLDQLSALGMKWLGQLTGRKGPNRYHGQVLAPQTKLGQLRPLENSGIIKIWSKL